MSEIKLKDFRELAFRLTELQTSHLKEKYQASKDPFFAWEAMQAFLQVGVPFPDWIRGYLKAAAPNLLELESQDKLNDAIAKALGFSPARKKGSLITRKENFALRWRAVTMVFNRKVEHPERPLEEIFSEVANFFDLQGKKDENKATIIKRWYFGTQDLVKKSKILGVFDKKFA
jgi:hypothetical protein